MWVQLKSKGKVSKALAVATCSLLSASAQAAEKNTNWDFTHLHYAEEGRVTVQGQVVAYKREQSDDKSFSFKLYHDSISGATPNGALPTDTYTSPSGQIYSGTPLQSFSDERLAASLQWQKQLSRLESRKLGLSISDELDYSSLGGSYTLDRDTSDRMSTYHRGVSFSLDHIYADGGIPTPLSPSTDMTRYASDNKVVVDLLAGVTHVLTRKSLMQMNYTLGLSNGYLSDPYKFVSVTGAGVEPLQYEYRPNTRIGHSFYVRWLANRNGGDVERLSYRLYMDDWGIFSHTLDIRYRLRRKNNGWAVQPHLRIYTQSAASFYAYSFFQDTPVTGYASSDYRLGNLQTLTAGVYLNRKLGRKSEFGMRFEYMQQTDRAGWFDTVDTLIAQISYKHK